MLYLRKIIDGDSEDLPAQSIINAMVQGVQVTRSDIVTFTGISVGLVSVTLSAMREHGVVRRVSQGVWVLNPKSKWIKHPETRRR